MDSALKHVKEDVLIDLAKRGRADCFAELIGRHRQSVSRRILSIVRNRFDAEDLAQEVWFKAWRALPTFRAESSFRTWLNRIATNEALMFYRREGRRRDYPTPVDFDGLQSPSEPLESRVAREEEAHLLRGAVVSLPSIYREVVVLCDLQELTAPETARRLKATLPAVKSRLFRARQMLLKTLRETGLGEPLRAAA